MKRWRVVLMVLLVPTALYADPIRIVDTGPGPDGLPGFALVPLQSVAVEFRVDEAAVITGAQGWMIVSQPRTSRLGAVSRWKRRSRRPTVSKYRARERWRKRSMARALHARLVGNAGNILDWV